MNEFLEALPWAIEFTLLSCYGSSCALMVWAFQSAMPFPFPESAGRHGH